MTDPLEVDTPQVTLAFVSAMSFVRKAVVVWLVAVFIVVALAFGLIYSKVSSIDNTVTAHNTELSQTLDAACILIRSDPKLPLPKTCPPVAETTAK